MAMPVAELASMPPLKATSAATTAQASTQMPAQVLTPARIVRARTDGSERLERLVASVLTFLKLSHPAPLDRSRASARSWSSSLAPIGRASFE
jgi:hypothetical protein